MAAGALWVLAAFAWPAPLAAEPSAILQYSGGVPASGPGGPEGRRYRPPTVARKLYARLPERDLYALALIPMSTELAGVSGIAGVTGGAYRGAGETYDDSARSAAGSLAAALGGALVAATLGAAALLAVGSALGRRRSRRPATLRGEP